MFLYGSQTAREIIGVRSLYGKNSGTYCYYVEIERKEKSYTVPGEITIEVDAYEDNRGRLKHFPKYYINRVYFSNGDYLDFSSSGYNYVSDLQDTVSVFDQSGDMWDCRILNEHAYCEQIQETSYISAKAVIELIAMLAIAVYNWAGYLCWDEKSMEAYKAKVDL